MNNERTLVLVKFPHCITHLDYIVKDLQIGMIQDRGEEVFQQGIATVPEEIWEQHYSEHRQKDFFLWLLKLRDTPVHLLVYEGPKVINNVRRRCGHSDPAKADIGTIRKTYSPNESLQASRDAKRPCYNAIHSSDSPEAAQKELILWGEFIGKDLTGKL